MVFSRAQELRLRAHDMVHKELNGYMSALAPHRRDALAHRLVDQFIELVEQVDAQVR